MQYQYTLFDMRVRQVPSLGEAVCWMRGLISKLGFRIEGEVAKQFPDPPGCESGRAYTAAFVLSESHSVIHTAPEDSWVEVVFAFCKEVPSNQLALETKGFFRPYCCSVRQFAGMPPAGQE